MPLNGFRESSNPRHFGTYQLCYFFHSKLYLIVTPLPTDNWSNIDNMSILLPTITEEKLAQRKHFPIKPNIADWWDQTAADNLRVDLFFKLSNSGCALCHSVLSHTQKNKREQHESEMGGLQLWFCLFVLFCRDYSHIVSKTWNRGSKRARSALCASAIKAAQGEGTPVAADFPWRRTARGNKRERKEKNTLTNRGGDKKAARHIKKMSRFWTIW